ncbi:hypothetical protein PVAG01_10522 [Phlyctema vagabunda]|uniref:Uncharacterized protein n=1 Tax=Phlyctema vagabunda TaxID=108571 RepID=A0ABR4P2I0_9HELO
MRLRCGNRPEPGPPLNPPPPYQLTLHSLSLKPAIHHHGSHPRICRVPGQEAHRSPDLRRSRLREHRTAEAGAGCHYPRAMGQEHDGSLGARGDGQMLLPGRSQPSGEVWRVKRTLL